MSSVSPYKKLSSCNKGWVPYCNIAKLKPNKAYLMCGISDTMHEKYGAGKQATLVDTDRKRVRSQLPGKYLSSLNPGDIEAFKKDIIAKKYPFLVFREVMVDNSYNIDIIPYGPDIVAQYRAGNDVPALESSCNEDDEDLLASAAPFDECDGADEGLSDNPGKDAKDGDDFLSGGTPKTP